MFALQAFELAASKSKEEHAARLASPLAENVAKRTAGLAQLVSKALSVNSTNEPAYIKARRDADIADQEYRVAVRRLDRQRLGLEERIEETLKVLQKWEIDRLRAVKTGMSYCSLYDGIVTDISCSAGAVSNCSWQGDRCSTDHRRTIGNAHCIVSS